MVMDMLVKGTQTQNFFLYKVKIGSVNYEVMRITSLH